MKPKPDRHTWLRPTLIVLGTLAILGLVGSAIMFTLWTDTAEIMPPQAQIAFEQALLEAGGGPAYILIADNDPTVVNRQLEPAEPRPFGKLVLLAWSPRDGKIIRQEFPRWFVRIKTSSAVNLGTMISLLRQDWQQLDVSVSYADLRRRGPGLLLDHRRQDGARIMLWTTADF